MQEQNEAAAVKVFGADWCSLTRATLLHLKRLKIPFDYIDIDQDRKAAEWVAAQNHGKEKKPTVDVLGEVLTTPTNQQLDDVLRGKGLLA